MFLLPLLLAAAVLPAQSMTTPVAPIVKGTGLPPPTSEEGQVMAPVSQMLAAINASDGAAIMKVVRPEGGATVALERPDGARAIRHLGWAEFAAGIKPEAGRLEERLGEPAIEIDGDIAMVWVPFTFLVDGKVQHCGTNHFDLVRENGAWKVLNVTWSQRTTGCEG